VHDAADPPVRDRAESGWTVLFVALSNPVGDAALYVGEFLRFVGDTVDSL
jgi:hypothetical protein